MARMIPRTLPAEVTSSAEWRLFEALRDGLDRSWTVLHSFPWLDDSGRTLREGECDFLLLHPERGLLAVEAKSGEIRYDGPTRTWMRSGTGIAIKDPFRQAASSAHYLNELIGRRVTEWRRLQPPFGHAVAFPEADRVPGNLPPHAVPDILILRPDLEHLQPRMEAILARYREASSCLLPDTLDAALGALLPLFDVAAPLSARLDAQETQLVRLTDEQVALLEGLDGNRRLLVEGGAGSGKTILALEKTLRLAAAGRRVLLLCYNIPLADRLRAVVAERGATADVFCFHDLVRHVVEGAGREYSVPLENRQEFFDRTAVELFYEAVPRFTPRWDALIVDEGQDFADEWWPPLEALLADPRESTCVVFTDPGQDLFGRAAHPPFAGPVFRLTTNCRNTARIAGQVNRFAVIPGRPSPRAPEGLPVEIVAVTDEEEERDAVRKVLHRLIHDQGIRAERIVILGRHRFEHSPFAYQPRLGNYQVIDNLEPGAPHQVRYATIYRFKGLEEDVVLLTGADYAALAGEEAEPVAAVERMLLYVGLSRARLLVVAFAARSMRRRIPATA
ncbi:MAG: NERD domain-containing protein [Candidatus Krumholzibacteriia bacterium]